jgi:methionyl-tRNA formyltransferase
MIDSTVSPRIVFMGTPDFAVASLQALVEAGFYIVGVVTAPDKPAGRGLQLQESAVKKYAAEKKIPVLQPIKLKDPIFLAALAQWNPDLQVVVAFRMLPEIVWNKPRMGTINLHGSLLPQYRGAAPINWALMEGEEKTGVTTFLLKQAIDTGDILLSKSIPIAPTDNFGTLYDKLKILGAQVLVETVEKYCKGALTPQPQPILTTPLKDAPKIQKETGKINWHQPALVNQHLIRGLSPHPGAYTFLDGKMLKIFSATIILSTPHVEPGTHQSDGKSFLQFACTDGWLCAEEIQLEGKKRMPIAAFLAGYRFN